MTLLYITLLFIIFVVNIFIPFTIRRHILNRFASGHLAEQVLYRLKVLQQYVHNVIIVISTISSLGIILKIMLTHEITTKITKEMVMREPILFISFMAIFYLIVLFNQYIYYRIYKMIMGIEITRAQFMLNTAKLATLLTIGPFLFFIVFKFKTFEQSDFIHYVGYFFSLYYLHGFIHISFNGYSKLPPFKIFTYSMLYCRQRLNMA